MNLINYSPHFFNVTHYSMFFLGTLKPVISIYKAFTVPKKILFKYSSIKLSTNSVGNPVGQSRIRTVAFESELIITLENNQKSGDYPF